MISNRQPLYVHVIINVDYTRPVVYCQTNSRVRYAVFTRRIITEPERLKDRENYLKKQNRPRMIKTHETNEHSRVIIS